MQSQASSVYMRGTDSREMASIHRFLRVRRQLTCALSASREGVLWSERADPKMRATLENKSVNAIPWLVDQHAVKSLCSIRLTSTLERSAPARESLLANSLAQKFSRESSKNSQRISWFSLEPAQTPWCATPPKGAAYNTPRRKRNHQC